MRNDDNNKRILIYHKASIRKEASTLHSHTKLSHTKERRRCAHSTPAVPIIFHPHGGSLPRKPPSKVTAFPQHFLFLSPSEEKKAPLTGDWCVCVKLGCRRSTNQTLCARCVFINRCHHARRSLTLALPLFISVLYNQIIFYGRRPHPGKIDSHCWSSISFMLSTCAD